MRDTRPGATPSGAGEAATRSLGVPTPRGANRSFLHGHQDGDPPVLRLVVSKDGSQLFGKEFCYAFRTDRVSGGVRDDGSGHGQRGGPRAGFRYDAGRFRAKRNAADDGCPRHGHPRHGLHYGEGQCVCVVGLQGGRQQRLRHQHRQEGPRRQWSVAADEQWPFSAGSDGKPVVEFGQVPGQQDQYGLPDRAGVRGRL